MQLFYAYQLFLLTFGTIQREVFKNCISSYSDACFAFAYRAYNPF